MLKKIVVVALLVLIQSGTALAHQLVTDQTSNLSAIVHYEPDDNPIAGEVSQIRFELQNDVVISSATVKISKYNGKKIEAINAKVDGRVISVFYTFPDQANYWVEAQIMTGTSAGQPVIFKTTENVTKGIKSASKTSTWMLYGLLGLTTLVALVITVFAKRQKTLIE